MTISPQINNSQSIVICCANSVAKNYIKPTIKDSMFAAKGQLQESNLEYFFSFVLITFVARQQL